MKTAVRFVQHPGELERLRSVERARRLVVWGIVAAFCGSGWHGLAWRVGDRRGSETALTLAFLGGLMATIAGVVWLWTRRVRHAAATPASCGVYRSHPSTTAEPRPRLELAFTREGWRRPVFGLLLLGVGSFLFGLAFHLAWHATRHIDPRLIGWLVLSGGLWFGGACALFSRSGLVLDVDHGVFFSWWGLGGPWFRRYYPADTVLAIEAETRRLGDRFVHGLTLQLADGERKRFFRVREGMEVAAVRAAAVLA